MLIVTGLISVAFGVVLSTRPDIGALALALLFGIFAIVYGCPRSWRAPSCAAPRVACTRSCAMAPDPGRRRGHISQPLTCRL
jgi:hypothetical protein